jgi:hypothetical protein
MDFRDNIATLARAGATGKTAFFDLLHQDDWMAIELDPAAPIPHAWPEGLLDAVDVQSHFHGKITMTFRDHGACNVLGLHVVPNFTIPRHAHPIDQLVFVLEGELRQGNRHLGPGSGYFTPAGSPYSVTSGPDGVTYVEIRHDPIDQLHTIWYEADPARWS